MEPFPREFDRCTAPPTFLHFFDSPFIFKTENTPFLVFMTIFTKKFVFFYCVEVINININIKIFD